MLSLEAALLMKDPALVTRWFIRVPDVTTPYECVAESAELSFAKTAAKGRHFQGTQRFYPEFKDIDGITITFYETWDFQVTKWLTKWRSKIVKDNGNYGVPVDYKRDIYADMYHLGKNSPILTFKFEGCWPTDRASLSLTYDDEVGRVQASVSFSVDKNTPTFYS